MLTLAAPQVAVPVSSPSDGYAPSWEPLEAGTALIDDVEVDDDGAPAGFWPRPHVLTIRPHEVERGDFLTGLPLSRVDGVLFDGASGRWLYTDDHGIVFAARRAWEQVQVVRGAPVVLRRVRHLRAVN